MTIRLKPAFNLQNEQESWISFAIQLSFHSKLLADNGSFNNIVCKTVRHSCFVAYTSVTCFVPYCGPSSRINTYQEHKYVCIWIKCELTYFTIGSLKFWNFKLWVHKFMFLGAFLKRWKGAINFVMCPCVLSVSLLARDNSAPTGPVLMKLDISAFVENMWTKFKFY
jgi:hypothetical protein